MNDKIFIIAGSHQEFDNWRRFNHNPVDKRYQNIIYVDSPDSILGIREPHGRFIGTWYRRRDIGDIIHRLRVAGSIDQKQVEKIMYEYDRLLFI